MSTMQNWAEGILIGVQGVVDEVFCESPPVMENNGGSGSLYDNCRLNHEKQSDAHQSDAHDWSVTMDGNGQIGAGPSSTLQNPSESSYLMEEPPQGAESGRHASNFLTLFLIALIGPIHNFLAAAP